MNQGSNPTKADPNQEGTGAEPTIAELRDAYNDNGGNIAATARAVDKSEGYVRKRLVENDIHEKQDLPLASRLEELDADAVSGGGEAAL